MLGPFLIGLLVIATIGSLVYFTSARHASANNVTTKSTKEPAPAADVEKGTKSTTGDAEKSEQALLDAKRRRKQKTKDLEDGLTAEQIAARDDASASAVAAVKQAVEAGKDAQLSLATNYATSRADAEKALTADLKEGFVVMPYTGNEYASVA